MSSVFGENPVPNVSHADRGSTPNRLFNGELSSRIDSSNPSWPSPASRSLQKTSQDDWRPDQSFRGENLDRSSSSHHAKRSLIGTPISMGRTFSWSTGLPLKS